MTAELEAEPSAAATLFGSRIDLARSYTAELARRGEELGLIGPLELGRLWSRHILNCVLLAPLLSPGLVADIGSGAGLPGIVLAIARPDVEFVLIEPMERRVEWLRAEASRLALANVEVVRSRVEDARLDRSPTQITARAVASLGKLIPLIAPVATPGARLLFLKGARVADEIAAARRQIARARLTDVEVLVLGGKILGEETRVFRATVG